MRAPAVRRVVTGLDSKGRSTVVSDGPAERTYGRTHTMVRCVWATEGPAPRDGDSHDLTAHLGDQLDLNVGAGGTRFYVSEFGPMDDTTLASSTAGMHVTPTIDYLYVVEGEIDLLFEDGSSTHLEAGDSLVQCGVMHAWRNRSGKVCKIAALMVGTGGPAPRFVSSSS